MSELNYERIAARIHQCILTGDEYENEIAQTVGILKSIETNIRAEYRFKNWIARAIIGRKKIDAFLRAAKESKK